MNEEADKLRSRLAELEAGIRVLGGATNTGTGKPVARRSQGKVGGWPKGKKRGPKGASAGASAVPDNVDVIPADLQAQIDAIKANPKLKGIAVAQAVRKAKIAYFKASAPASSQGAGLAEAAAS